MMSRLFNGSSCRRSNSEYEEEFAFSSSSSTFFSLSLLTELCQGVLCSILSPLLPFPGFLARQPSCLPQSGSLPLLTLRHRCSLSSLVSRSRLGSSSSCDLVHSWTSLTQVSFTPPFARSFSLLQLPTCAGDFSLSSISTLASSSSLEYVFFTLLHSLTQRQTTFTCSSVCIPDTILFSQEIVYETDSDTSREAIAVNHRYKSTPFIDIQQDQ